jgi:transcriptional regulator with XRE-family HTH domain
MAKKFRDLVAKMPEEARKRGEQRARERLAAMPLDELRHAREITQQHLAYVLGVNQAAVSRMERRTDMYVSTLRNFIEAMGGRLEVRAVFPDLGAVEVTQFAGAARAVAEEEREHAAAAR